MTNSYDALVIGGGHNGLVSAAYLARSGARTLVLEGRSSLGGAATTESPWADAPHLSVTRLSYVMSLMPATIVRELDLVQHGYKVHPMGPYYQAFPEGGSLTIYEDDPARTHEQLAKWSKKDADAWPKWNAWLEGIEQQQAEKPEPVAICRLKRVAADYKDDDIAKRLPKRRVPMNGKRVACVGGGPASLTVARDLAPQGYAVTVFDQDPQAGGMIRTQIPRFRLPEEVIDEETGYILGLGVEFRGGVKIESMKALLAENYDAIFVGSGAPRGRDLELPGRAEAAAKIHVGIEWLSSVSFGHVTRIGKRVIVLGGGNTAMDCCRTSKRLGGEEVKVIVRSGFEEMKASPWEKEDAMHEGIPILNYLVPKAFLHNDGRLTGMSFEKCRPSTTKRVAAR